MLCKNFEKLELNKILSAAAEYAVLDGGRSLVMALSPSVEIAQVRRRLSFTRECTELLFTYGLGKIERFGNVAEQIKRAGKGSVLSCKELLECAALLRSARTVYESVSRIDDENIVLVKECIKCLYFDKSAESDITEKILSEDSVSDNASDKLFAIRSKIKNLNDRVRSRLSEYVSGKDKEYLQDAIVTLRNDRYVIPVKAEHKGRVRGFVHDRSKTGATYFIEPEDLLELNNEIIALTVDEREEVEAILRALSKRIGDMAEELAVDITALSELDSYLAVAEYCYKLKCTEPKVNTKGHIDIIRGRHPLIDKAKVVPVSVELGSDYNFILLSGANTGGKTVTLKMTGLFCLMAACGFFIPAAEGSSVSVFQTVFCAVGDSQSIEEELSTFSSHISAVIDICNSVGDNSLVLIDELGGGTNPDEGQAIAKAVVRHLLSKGAKGIVTTHFTALKEFAYGVEGIENASMEFDMTTLKPLYRMKRGLPGASNALAISKRLGMSEELLKAAENELSEGARSFENVVRRAEESRIEAEERLTEIKKAEIQWREKLAEVNAQIEKLNKEREKINRSARTESRRIISERTERAEEILAEIEEIFKKERLSENDLVAARTLRNKLKNTAFEEESDLEKVNDYFPATSDNIGVGTEVYVKPMETCGRVVAFSRNKGDAEVQCENLRMHLKLRDLLVVTKSAEKTIRKVKIVKNLPKDSPVLEINVLGMTVIEALYEVDNFIDKAVTDNLEEIKVIHGVGTGKLRKAIAEHLKRHKNVESFRSGIYGEGETGVTFIKLK